MKIGLITVLSAMLLIVVYLFTLNGQTSSDNTITVQQVLERVKIDTTIVLLDVRTDPEFTGSLGHLPGAILIPLAGLKARLGELEEYRENQIIVVCRSGNRSRSATNVLRTEGFNAVNMVGGMLAWNKMMETMNNDSSGVKNETTVD